MESTTNPTRTLGIDGMSGDACVQKVTDALKGVHAVSIESVKVGSATIGADQAGCTAACAAIGAAGYRAREGVRRGVRTDEACPGTAAKAPERQTASTPAKPVGAVTL